jgi:hypothetical protein
VMGYVVLAFFGMLPLGSLLISTLSQRIGAPLTMLCQGIASILFVALFYRLFDSNDGYRIQKPIIKKKK